jgi:Tol biopolymer transport system component
MVDLGDQPMTTPSMTAPRVLALAAAAGLCGCGMESKQATLWSRAHPLAVPTPGAPQAPAAAQRQTAATSTPASQGPTRPPAEFYNAVVVASGGVQANRPADTGVMRPAAPAATRPAPTPPVNTGLGLYGEALAASMNGRVADGARAAGANLSQVSFSQEGADFDPDVSRDGKQIVFASTQHRATSDLYIKNVESRVVTQLTNDPANDVMPRISPDGTRIAFSSNRNGNWDIFVMPITGGRSVQITSSGADELHPSWSPDGNQIVFCRLGEMSGQWEMWVTDVGNSGVAKFIGYGLFPEWCPVAGSGAGGADRIAYQKSRERGDRAFGIWTLDYKDGQAGNTTEIVSSTLAACINPAWSPDGKWLAFATVPNASKWAASPDSRPPAADLWMVDIEGNTRMALTSGKALNLMPAWGPGNRLFFVSDRNGTDNLWAMDTTGVIELAMTNMRSNSAVASHMAPPSSVPSVSSPPAAPTPERTEAIVPSSENSGHDPH